MLKVRVLNASQAELRDLRNASEFDQSFCKEDLQPGFDTFNGIPTGPCSVITSSVVIRTTWSCLVTCPGWRRRTRPSCLRPVPSCSTCAASRPFLKSAIGQDLR